MHGLGEHGAGRALADTLCPCSLRGCGVIQEQTWDGAWVLSELVREVLVRRDHFWDRDGARSKAVPGEVIGVGLGAAAVLRQEQP